jgi:hypothetical protein
MNLTQNVNMQDGSIWNTKNFSFSNDFSVSANYYFGNTNGGADGIYFFMKPLGRWPNGGTAGAANGTAVSNTGGYIGLFFDTYQNGNELANDHLTVYAVKSDGSSTVYTRPNGVTGVPLKNSSGAELTDVENDVFYPFTIVWRASARTLSVYGGASANSQFYSTVITTGEMDGTNFSFGWQGITGGANNYQAINNVQYHLPATITSNPTNVTVNSGDTATVTAAYTTTEGSATTYWQFSDDGGAFWNNTGATTTSYSFPTSRSISGRKYRFYVETTAFGTTHSAVSNSMTLFVNAPPTGVNDDYAISLNGTSQYVSAADDNAFDVSNAITLEAWVKPTALPGNSSWKLVINKAANYQLGMMSTGGRTYWGYALQGNAVTGWVGESTTVAVALNEWHHIAITREADTSTVRFYYDGNLAYIGSADVAGTGSLNNSAYPLVIGARYNNVVGYAETFTGMIDQVAIFGLARSEALIKSDMHNYLAGNTTGLQAYFDFNEGSGATIYNRVVGTTASTDLATTGSPSFTSVVETSTVGPYSVVKFPRTVLNSGGGWKFTGETRTASVLVLGGGGAGGGGYQGGGGGAGGFIETRTTLTTAAPYAIKVGAGGKGASNPIAPTGGDTSTAFGFNALGGGRGASEWDNTNDGGLNYFNVTTEATSGGSGGGGAWGTDPNKTPGNGTTGQGNAGGLGSYLPHNGNYASGGGGGAGSAGEAPTPTNTWTVGGKGGAGVLSLVLGSRVAGGGGGASRFSTTIDRAGVAVDGGGTGAWNDNKWPGESGGAQNGTANTGGGGGGSASSDGRVAGRSGFGGSGIVAIRWITASKPTYTKPTNTTLDVGQTETFTVNVASDSATVMLTRTFKWESTTGADNAYFAWVPTDTSTSGSSYLYRLTVTDSDTAGLFITDSSTAYATINAAMVASGTQSLVKTVNRGKSETYTITLGTGPYKISWLGAEPNLRFETTTATVLLKVSDTASVGTYYETITVVDSVSAVLLVPVIIKVVSPPSLLLDGALTSTGLVLDYQIGHSQSLLGKDGQATTGLTLRDLSGRQNDASTGGTFANILCNAPTYSKANGGAVGFGTNKCYASSYNGDDLRNHYTAEVWFKKTGSFGLNSFLLSQPVNTSAHSTILVGSMGETDQSLRVGFYADGLYRSTSCGYIPNLNEWTHIAGTYDGQTLKTYINGNLLCSTPNSVSIPDNSFNTDPIIIGVGPAGGGIYINAQIASVRLYKTPLSDSEIAENYRLSKTRFTSASNFLASISKKYGASSQETYTVVSGTETNTVSFSVGSKTGISWDSTTSTSLIKLKLQESATVGSYTETLTVTDFNGSTTFLPLSIEIAKADTLTVTMESATVTSYNGLKLTVYPKPIIRGLVSSDTATSVTRFSSAIYSETSTVPTNADTYTVRGSELIFSLGSLDNYAGIVFETSTAVINKIYQRPLNVYMYGGVVGMPFLISLQGGDGDGAVTETLTGVSTIPGCSISNHYLSSTTTQQGFCEVRVVKAGNQNYYTETQTVQMYFMAFENNQPTGQVGSGSTIALNGVTSFNVDPTAPPTITALSATTISLAGLGTFVITGTGFGTGGLVVKFYRNKTLAPASATATSITFNVADMSSVLGSSGRVTVITNNGQTLSADSVTVNP